MVSDENVGQGNGTYKSVQCDSQRDDHDDLYLSECGGDQVEEYDSL